MGMLTIIINMSPPGFIAEPAHRMMVMPTIIWFMLIRLKSMLCTLHIMLTIIILLITNMMTKLTA